MEKPKAKLIGANGNIFNLMAIAGREIGQIKKEEMIERVFKAKSYDEALAIIGEYVEII